MSSDYPRRPFGDAWLRFVGAAEHDLARLPVRRPHDQYIQFKNAVLDEVKREEIADNIETALANLYTDPKKTDSVRPDEGRRIAELVRKEMDAYVAAVQVQHQMHEESAPTELPTPRLSRLGKTTLDSLREIVDTLPPHVKALLKLFSEVFELFD